MAEVKQDFIKFEDDRFIIKYVVTDSSDISGMAAYFMMTNNFASPTTGNTLRKYSGTWSNGSPCPGGIDAVTGVNQQVAVSSGAVTVIVTHAEMNTYFSTTDAYAYHELVLATDNITGNQCKSTVVSTGWMEVRESLFTTEGYRA